jgi:hypothetical protein
MVTLSFSEAIMASLEQERAKACELNNLRLYKMVQGLGWLVGLDSRGRGRKAKLNGAQQQALYELVVAGPLANGFDCGV